MKLLLLPVVLAALGQAGDDAEKRFKAMEDKIRKADALRVTFACDFKNDQITFAMKGTLTVRAPNKARLEADASFFGKDMKIVMVSDGTKMVNRTDGQNNPAQDTPKFFQEMLTSLVSRTGITIGALTLGNLNDKQKNPLDELKVSDFKAKPAEQVNGRNAAVIAYKLAIKNDQAATAIVWLDAATGLPLKRALQFEMGNQRFTVTETYSDLRLNPQLDARLFELPKTKEDPK